MLAREEENNYRLDSRSHCCLSRDSEPAAEGCHSTAGSHRRAQRSGSSAKTTRARWPAGSEGRLVVELVGAALGSDGTP